MIDLKGIDKTFETESGSVHAVVDVDLKILKGDIYGIIGFSGAGKSTLVRCINLLERPTRGTVSIDGVELTALSPKALREERKKIGMIFQQFNLFESRTVAENIALPMKNNGQSKKQVEEKVQSLLEVVDLVDKKDAYPSQLSGGQKQRVAIARALANDPKVLLCDEATSALDPQTTDSILQLLKQLNVELGLTIVVITHEMRVVREICNKVAVMEEGRVVEKGEVFRVFTEPKAAITRDFIETTSNLKKVYELVGENSEVTRLAPGEVLLRSQYLDKDTTEPLVSYVSRAYNLDFNIIFADVEIVEGAAIGGLVSIVSGKPEEIDQGLAYLKEHNVRLEVIQDARVS